jgi:hypothetical protein
MLLARRNPGKKKRRPVAMAPQTHVHVSRRSGRFVTALLSFERIDSGCV